VLRVYDTTKLESDEAPLPEREFQDVVNRHQWKVGGFSCTSDYVIGGSAERAEHKIYIWDRERGQLVKTLEGQKDGILHLAVRH